MRIQITKYLPRMAYVVLGTILGFVLKMGIGDELMPRDDLRAYIQMTANVSTAIAAWFAYRLAWKRWGHDSSDRLERLFREKVTFCLEHLTEDLLDPIDVASSIEGLIETYEELALAMVYYEMLLRKQEIKNDAIKEYSANVYVRIESAKHWNPDDSGLPRG